MAQQSQRISLLQAEVKERAAAEEAGAAHAAAGTSSVRPHTLVALRPHALVA